MDSSNKGSLMKVKGMTLRGAVKALFILSVAALMIFAGIISSEESLVDSLRFWFFGIVFIPFAFVAFAETNRQDENQADFMREISDEEFEQIKSQLTADRFHYKTYYLTDTALYVPSRGLLFTYKQMEYAYVHIHRGKGIHRWHIHVVDKKGCSYSFDVKQYSAFVRNRAAVMYQLNAKCSGGAEFEKIFSQLTDEKFYYKTYYLTDSGLYVPDAGLALNYDQMQSVYAHRHSIRGIPRWHIHITDKEGCDYFFTVKKYFAFVRNKDNAIYHIRSMFDKRAEAYLQENTESK